MDFSNLFFWMRILAVLVWLYLHGFIQGQTKADPHTSAAVVSAYFTPPAGQLDGPTRIDSIEISKARRTIFFQAYGLTSKPIVGALINAKTENHVDVEGLLDKSDRGNPLVDLLAKSVSCYEDAKESIAHNKILIIDGKEVVTGSFNFTHAAEYDNAENIIIVRSTTIAKLYFTNWQLHRAHSTPW